MGFNQCYLRNVENLSEEFNRNGLESFVIPDKYNCEVRAIVVPVKLPVNVPPLKFNLLLITVINELPL